MCTFLTVLVVVASVVFIIYLVLGAYERECENELYESLFYDNADETFEIAMRCKCECDVYKKLYEDLCKWHNELLDKYEELYKQKGE